MVEDIGTIANLDSLSQTNMDLDIAMHIKQYKAFEICEFFHTDQANEMMENLDRSHPALMMSTWFICSVVDSRSRMIVVEQTGRSVGYFIYSLEHKFGKDICHAHRYDLFPESIDVECIKDVCSVDITRLVLQTLKNNKCIIDVDGIRKDALIINVIDEIMPYVRIEDSADGRYLTSFPSYDEFLENSSRSFRSTLYRCQKRLEELGVGHRIVTEKDDNLINKMFELHSEVFGDSSEILKRVDVYKTVIESAFNSNSAILIVFNHGDEPVAIDFILYDYGVYYEVNGGRKVDKIYSGIGKLVMIYTIIESFKLGAKRVDLMRPDNDLKEKMGGEILEYVRLRCAPSRFSWTTYRFAQEFINVFNRLARKGRKQ